MSSMLLLSDISDSDVISVLDLVRNGLYSAAIQFLSRIYSCAPNVALEMVDQIIAVHDAEADVYANLAAHLFNSRE